MNHSRIGIILSLMMREPVAIVLNEREPAKLRTVEELLSNLAEYGITASRIDITADIVEIIRTRQPKVLVLDYLLGDYSTGPDVMAAFENIKREKRPKFFFLTDEPSVQVAVNALRMGAMNYFEIDSADSVKRLASEIHQCLRQERIPERAPVRNEPEFDDLVAQSREGRQMIERAKSVAAQQCPIVTIQGPSGSGISTIADAFEKECNNGSFVRTVDMRYFAGSIGELVGTDSQTTENLRLGNNLFLIVEHADQDGGELLDLVHSKFTSLWPSKLASPLGSRLVVCTQDTSTAEAWQRMLKAENIKLLSLDKRRDDIPPLVQRFVRETEDLLEKKVKQLSPEVVDWLSGLDWPGNIRELRSCTIDTLLRSSVSDESIKALFEDVISFARENSLENSSISLDPLMAATVLSSNGMSYRVAAAKLGVSVQGLHSLLNSPELIQ